jgi:2-polyprenyl-6-methoxyphenol hydroxylase-like FAD-dependent oxidoreductase
MNRHAEIAGGGIAGLTMAIALRKHGWGVTLHERNSELREIGAALYLKFNSLRVLHELEVLPAVRAAGVRLREGQIRDERGRVIMRRQLPPGEEAITILRPELHRILAQCAISSGARICTNSEVTSADPAGFLTLKSGEVRPADLIVGADGYRSPVRGSVNLTRRLLSLQEGAIRTLAPRFDEQDGLSVEYWRGDCRVGIVPCTKEQLYVYLLGPLADPRASALPVDKDYWCSRFPDVAHVIRRIPDGAGHHDQLMLGTPHHWSAGRVAIIGDAAHAQPPNLGQGAGMSMANAFALAMQAGRNPDVAEALRVWEATRRPISDAVQNWSYRYGLLGYGLPAKFWRLRSALVWALARTGPINRRWGWLWRGGHDSSETLSLGSS